MKENSKGNTILAAILSHYNLWKGWSAYYKLAYALIRILPTTKLLSLCGNATARSRWSLFTIVVRTDKVTTLIFLQSHSEYMLHH